MRPLQVMLFLALCQTVLSAAPVQAVTSPTELTPCPASSLTAATGSGDSAMGHRQVHVLLRNRSSRPCTLEGFPAISLLDATGHTLPISVDRNRGDYLTPKQAVSRIVLSPGDEAGFFLGFSAVRTSGACNESDRIMITPPGSREPLLLDAKLAPCGRVNLSPIHMTENRSASR